MAYQIASNVDFSQNQLIRAVIESSGSFPTVPTPISGQLYYKTGANEGFYYYKVDHWEELSALYADSSDLTATNTTLETYVVGGSTYIRIKTAGVGTTELDTDAVTTIKVLDNAITLGKIAQIPTLTVLGRVTSGTGNVEEISILTDTLLAGASNTNLATTLAIKTYIDNKITGMGNLEGSITTAATSFPVASGGTKKGDMWWVTGGAGTLATIDGVLLRPGDIIMAEIDDASTTLGADWSVFEGNKDIANTTTLGIVMLASAGDITVDIMTESQKVITPALLQLRTATETRAGMAEIATQAEANALTLDDKIVTPAKLPIASTTQKGLAQVATQLEVDTGTDALKYVTPLTLKAITDASGAQVALVGGALSVAVTHTKGDNAIALLQKVSDGSFVGADIKKTNSTTFTVYFGTPSAPSAGAYRLIIVNT
jgi:hypothetical protein